MKNKSNTGLIVIIIVLVAVLTALGGYLVGINITKDKVNNNDNATNDALEKNDTKIEIGELDKDYIERMAWLYSRKLLVTDNIVVDNLSASEMSNYVLIYISRFERDLIEIDNTLAANDSNSDGSTISLTNFNAIVDKLYNTNFNNIEPIGSCPSAKLNGDRYVLYFACGSVGPNYSVEEIKQNNSVVEAYVNYESLDEFPSRKFKFNYKKVNGREILLLESINIVQ